MLLYMKALKQSKKMNLLYNLNQLHLLFYIKRIRGMSDEDKKLFRDTCSAETEVDRSELCALI